MQHSGCSTLHFAHGLNGPDDTIARAVGGHRRRHAGTRVQCGASVRGRGRRVEGNLARPDSPASQNPEIRRSRKLRETGVRSGEGSVNCH